MDAEQLWETTMDPEKRILRRVVMDEEEASEIDVTFNTLMGDKVEPRRDFIEANAKYVQNLDIQEEEQMDDKIFDQIHDVDLKKTINESKHQGTDMCTIHIGIGHNNNLMIS